MNTAPQTAQEAAPTRQQEQLAPELVLGMLAQLVSFAQQMQPATRLSRLRGWLATLLHPRRAKPPAPDAAARAEILALLGQLNAIATAFPPQPTPQPISELSPSETPTAAQPCSPPATPRRPAAPRTRPAPTAAKAPARAVSPASRRSARAPYPPRETNRPRPVAQSSARGTATPPIFVKNRFPARCRRAPISLRYRNVIAARP